MITIVDHDDHFYYCRISLQKPAIFLPEILSDLRHKPCAQAFHSCGSQATYVPKCPQPSHIFAIQLRMEAQSVNSRRTFPGHVLRLHLGLDLLAVNGSTPPILWSATLMSAGLLVHLSNLSYYLITNTLFQYIPV